MSVAGRTAVLGLALAGGLAGSQAPEFAQQYRQRLGGAVDEMRQVVAEFDEDVRRNGLDRDEAVSLYAQSPEAFLKDRGLSMKRLLSRFSTLSRQQAELELAEPLMRPVIVLRNPDQQIVQGAWQIYEPAVPVTAAGAVWAFAGLSLIGGFAWFSGKMLRFLFVNNRRRSEATPS
ncbi:DUF2937 family protein [Afifella marina]|uniref:DUF2937 family protein n=1 Tax=Afifella marina DSM 2698 TaxID=1120955 RepID=A0A1G5P2B1_AFIMA|nr:DUF2937 family protein [Afifella marina]MBK1624277.1 DUF2937 domain-containing protein [Afifella marina DSM 2698]MBK1628010.1 DUF2937 domain-containing protein [Afifella marina]MBK5918204.1 hypothetical protein [Afifella marina]RAI19245.1 hypothetical protein CH311_13135 [Afifella marina DSM 2698]SCZ43378.1 Protein of unknown function [Afifella marina DSM 2698]